MRSHTISVPFVKGKKRVRFGNGHAYIPSDTRSYMQAIKTAWGDSEKAPKGVPVRVFIRCEREMPKSRVRKGKREEADVFYPDVDNIEKLVLDALNGVAWFDDRQIVSISTEKANRRAGIGYESTEITVCWEESDEIQGIEGR